MLTKSRMTLAEFLALPEEKPYREFINGEVVEKPMPNNDHGDLCGMLVYLWHALAAKAGRTNLSIGPEVRHLYQPGTPFERAYLPDVSVTERLPGEPRNLVRSVPGLAIEVISPGDRPGRIAEKMQFYMQANVLAWLVDPESQTITVFLPGEPAAEYARGSRVRADPYLPSEFIEVDAVFSVINR